MKTAAVAFLLPIAAIVVLFSLRSPANGQGPRADSANAATASPDCETKLRSLIDADVRDENPLRFASSDHSSEFYSVYPECKPWLEGLRAASRAKEVAALPPRARAVCKRHPSFDADACAAIAKREVKIGFSPAEIRAAWGAPDHVNTSFAYGHTTEQWVYGNQGQYLYLDDGKLTSWQSDE